MRLEQLKDDLFFTEEKVTLIQKELTDIEAQKIILQSEYDRYYPKAVVLKNIIDNLELLKTLK